MTHSTEVSKLKPSPYKLSPQDQEKRLWKQVDQYIEEAISKNQMANDKDLDPIKTANIRGQNKALRALKNAFAPKQLPVGGQRGRIE